MASRRTDPRDTSTARSRRPSAIAVLVTCALIGAACSGGSSDADPTDTATASTQAAPVATESADFEPIGSVGENEDPFADEPTVDPDDFDLEIDDDVIIATPDGEIPPTTTDPPVEGTPDEPPAVDAPTTTAEPVAVPEPADIGRIVSVSATHTETLFALGLGEFVVAVDRESDFPEAALAVRDGELGADSADISRLLSYDPDIVIVGDDPTGIVGRLNEAGVASYLGPQADSLAEVYEQITDIATLLDRADLGEELVATMQADIDEIVGSLPDGADGLTVYHEIDPTLFTVGSDSFHSDVYSVLGLANIAGPSGLGGVAQLTEAEIFAADPDVIVLADFNCCDVTIDRLAARPGWADLSAVQSSAVVTVDDPLVFRWGPRVVDLLRQVAGGVIAATS